MFLVVGSVSQCVYEEGGGGEGRTMEDEDDEEDFEVFCYC